MQPCTNYEMYVSYLTYLMWPSQNQLQELEELRGLTKNIFKINLSIFFLYDPVTEKFTGLNCPNRPHVCSSGPCAALLVTELRHMWHLWGQFDIIEYTTASPYISHYHHKIIWGKRFAVFQIYETIWVVEICPETEHCDQQLYKKRDKTTAFRKRSQNIPWWAAV